MLHVQWLDGTYWCWSNCLIDTSVNGSTHVGKWLVEFVLQLLILVELVEEKGSLNSSKLLCRPLAKQVIQKTC